MGCKTGNHPVILLVDETAKNCGQIRQWLERNEYLTCEAADIFQAIEQVSDFTVRQCPDVVLLEVDALSQDFVREMFRTSYGTNEVFVLALSNSSQNNGSGDHIAQLKKRLDGALPCVSHAA
jgi:Response regulator containing CheY-like receiver, AAA-type ATPase, and DNA-binding domains